MKTLPFIAAFVVSSSLAVTSAHAELFDHSAWDAILQHYVDTKGSVDYDGIRQNAQSALESYLEQLREADMGGWSPLEQLAFWVNAYNAIAVENIVLHPKMKKLSENFDLMDKPFKLAGRTLSMNDIAFRILRGKKNPSNQLGPIPNVTITPEDLRVLFVLNPGTKGGPRLVNKAFTAENIDSALDFAVTEFVNASDHVDADMGVLKLSTLFRTCRRDFAGSGGVESFINQHLDADKRGGDIQNLQDTLGNPHHTVTYSYDWTINDAKISSVDDSAVKDLATPPSVPVPPSDSSAPPEPTPPPDPNDASTSTHP